MRRQKYAIVCTASDTLERVGGVEESSAEEDHTDTCRRTPTRGVHVVRAHLVSAYKSRSAYRGVEVTKNTHRI